MSLIKPEEPALGRSALLLFVCVGGRVGLEEVLLVSFAVGCGVGEPEVGRGGEDLLGSND
jgi:hypothetical protein